MNIRKEIREALHDIDRQREFCDHFYFLGQMDAELSDKPKRADIDSKIYEYVMYNFKRAATKEEFEKAKEQYEKGFSSIVVRPGSQNDKYKRSLKESSWKEEAKKREKIWSCIEYFASGNYNELADYQFSSEQLIKQAKDYIKGSKYQKFLKCCEKTLKEQKSESDTVGWYMDGEGGWADIPLLKKHLDSSFVGIHNDGTYFFDTEDPSERSGDMLSFRGFSEVLHRLGLKVDAHKVSDQLYKLSPQRLKIDLIEADMSLWESKKEKYHSYQDWKDSCKGLYGPFIRFVPSTSADKTEVWRSKRMNPSTGKSIETKKLPSYYDHIEQIGYVIREIKEQKNKKQVIDRSYHE